MLADDGSVVELDFLLDGVVDVHHEDRDGLLVLFDGGHEQTDEGVLPDAGLALSQGGDDRFFRAARGVRILTQGEVLDAALSWGPLVMTGARRPLYHQRGNIREIVI